MSRTKIVCTIGPACRSPKTIRELITSGMNVARLNFSHADLGQHGENIRMIRDAADEMGRAVAKYRPRARILAVTPLPEAYRQLSLIWGVVPVLTDRFIDTDQTVALAQQIAAESGRIRSGDRFIITGGVPVGVTGTTNSITAAILP